MKRKLPTATVFMSDGKTIRIPNAVRIEINDVFGARHRPAFLNTGNPKAMRNLFDAFGKLKKGVKNG
jgi:hypothetical protein